MRDEDLHLPFKQRTVFHDGKVEGETFVVRPDGTEYIVDRWTSWDEGSRTHLEFQVVNRSVVADGVSTLPGTS